MVCAGETPPPPAHAERFKWLHKLACFYEGQDEQDRQDVDVRRTTPRRDRNFFRPSFCALFHNDGILTEGCGKGAEEDNAGTVAVAVRRTPPTARKVPGDSEAAKPRRKRRLRRTTEIEKILTRVRAGSTAIQLIRPDGESGDLDMDVEELIDACIEYSHVRSVELQVRDIA